MAGEAIQQSLLLQVKLVPDKYFDDVFFAMLIKQVCKFF